MRHVAAVITIGLSSFAFAQERPSERPRPADDAPLAGPPVREQRMRGVEQGFSESRRDGAGGRLAQGVPHRVFMEAVKGLRGEGEHAAPAELRLSESQEEQIAALDKEFKERTRAPARKARPAGPGGQAARDGDRAARPAEPPRPPMADEGRPRDRGPQEMRPDAPRPADLHAQMYSVLSQEQRAYVEQRVGEWRERMEKQRSEEYVKRRMQQRAAEGGAPAGQPPRDGAAGAGRERIRRIAEKLAQLPPEERDRLLTRLEQEVDRRLSEGGDRPAPPRPPEGAGRPPRTDR